MLKIKDKSLKKSRRTPKRWSSEETETLKKAVAKHGKKWAMIQKIYPVFKNNKRTQIDLKDKYRNLTTRSPKRKKQIVSVEYEYILYGKESCIYCKEAVQMLKTRNKNYKYVEIKNDKQLETLYNIIDKKTNNYRYFPIIFKNGKFIGGYTELKNII